MDANTIIGRGVPANTFGNDGQFYADLPSGIIYGPKTNGVWGHGVRFNEFDASVLEVPAEDLAFDQSTEPTPLQKLDIKIAEMEADGGELYAAAIEALKFERDKLVADAEVKAAQVEEKVKSEAAELKTDVQTFEQKHRVAIGYLIDAVKIVIWIVVAGKFLGVI